MSILLDTGSINSPLTAQSQFGNVTVDNVPAERVVYPNNKEQLIVVKEGEMVVLTSYGATGTQVIVSKLLISNGSPELGTGGCNPIISSSQSTVLNRVALPCYTMCEGQPLAVIDIPGIYAVAPVSDPNGDVIVTAVGHKLQQSGPKCGCCSPEIEFEV